MCSKECSNFSDVPLSGTGLVDLGLSRSCSLTYTSQAMLTMIEAGGAPTPPSTNTFYQNGQIVLIVNHTITPMPAMMILVTILHSHLYL